MNYDRFCGGYLNVESDEEESIPLYSEVSSQIIWLQLVTGMRTPRVLEELAKNTYQGRNGGFFNGGRYKNGLNEGYDGTGPGFRIRYSQLENCFDGSFILT